MMTLRASTLLACLLAAQVHADTVHDELPDPSRRSVEFVGSLGLTTGGDDLGTFEFVDGDSADIEAGGLFSFALGLGYQLKSSPVYLQSTVGYHFDSVDANNGEASFSRVPLEFLAFYKAKKFRVGGGLTYHLSPELEFELDGFGTETFDFDNAAGLVLQTDYLVTPKLGFGVRAVFIDYEASDANVDSIDGNQFGLHATILL